MPNQRENAKAHECVHPLPGFGAELEEEFGDEESEIPVRLDRPDHRERFRLARLDHFLELFDRVDRVASSIGFVAMIGLAYFFGSSWLTLNERMVFGAGLVSLVFCFFLPLKDPSGVFGQIVQISMILTMVELVVFVSATWILKFAVI